MKWTEPHGPQEGASPYDHVMCKTPIGVFFIEWKSWKSSPDYGINLNDEYIGTEYSLEEAKRFCEEYLVKLVDEVNQFLLDE